MSSSPCFHLVIYSGQTLLVESIDSNFLDIRLPSVLQLMLMLSWEMPSHGQQLLMHLTTCKAKHVSQQQIVIRHKMVG
jgi:hypothetical protein